MFNLISGALSLTAGTIAFEGAFDRQPATVSRSRASVSAGPFSTSS
mgnify:CR=1 FL=1